MPAPSDLSAAAPTIKAFGDAGLLASFEQRIDPLISARVHAAAAAVHRARVDGAAWLTAVPGYASLLVPYDSRRLSQAEATAALQELLATTADAASIAGLGGEPLIEIPVRYGGADGPDLDEVARACSLRPAEVIALHSSVTYRAYLLGFAPGFAYLGELPAQLALARRPTPRRRVAAGSVAIAGRQTAVYPLATPGGWHLIGRTELAVWDPARPDPALVRPGQHVRFRPIA